MMIRSTGYALSWDYWRRGMLWFAPACAAVVVGCTALLHTMMAFAFGAANAAALDELNRAVPGFVCWAPIVFAVAWRNATRRHYALPVSTAAIAGWSLANGAVAVSATYCLIALALKLICGVDWPIAGPAWWSAVAYIVLQPAIWATALLRGYQLVLVAIGGMFLVPFAVTGISHLVSPSHESPNDWSEMTLTQFAVSLGVVALGWLAGVLILGRDRRGDTWSGAWANWRASRGGEVPPVTSAEFPTGVIEVRSFRSPQAAQFWLEWHRKGRIVVMSAVGGVVALWAFLLLTSMDRPMMHAVVSGVSAMFLVLGPFLGLCLGIVSQRFDIKPFAATRPLSDRDMSAAVLRNAAACVDAVAAIWLVNVVAMMLIWRDPVWHNLAEAWSKGELAQMHANVFFPFVLLLLAVWTFVGLGVTLALTRSWFVPLGALMSGLLLVPFVLSLEDSLDIVALLLRLGFATLFLVATVAAFVLARRHDLISTRAVLGCVLAFALLMAYVSITSHLNGPTALTHFQRLGFCAIPFFPLAAAPLALRWNRHR